MSAFSSQPPQVYLYIESVHTHPTVKGAPPTLQLASIVPVFIDQTLETQVLTFGRLSSSTFVLPDPAVSLVHCTLWHAGRSNDSPPLVYLADRDSLNGTYHNGTLLQKGQTVLLEDEDVVEIKCGIRFTFSSWDLRATKPPLSLSLSPWIVLHRRLGRGSFGKVYLAKQKLSPLLYAVKVTARPHPSETKLLPSLCHPNIIRVYQTVTLTQTYIFQELMPGGDLFTYLCKDYGPSPLPESECLMIMYQVLLGLNYLHQQGVVHRDLKLENILLEFPAPCSRVVLADFGAAWVHGQNPTSGRVGTPGYTAPELGLSDLSSSDDSETDNEILIETAPNAACDMYSLGVVLHRILSGTAPLFESIGGQRRINWQNAGWRTVSKTARQTVAKLLCENPLNRITCEGCSRLPWIGHRQQLLAYIYQTVVLRNQGPLGDVGYGNKGLTRGPTKRGGEGGAKKVRKGFKRDPKGV